MLQLLVNFIYSLIRSSWMVSAIAVKYILAGELIYAYRLEGDLRGNLEKNLVGHSRETVSIIVLLGFLSLVSGFELSPLVELPSFFAAVSYFGYLFWRF